MRIFTIPLLGLGVLLLTGCASIINGRSQSIDFDSRPSGADLTVGGLKATTPAKLTLTRKETYLATFVKQDYPERSVTLAPRSSWWLLGNLAFGGLIGIIIDLATGSGMTLSPDEVYMDLATGTVTDLPAREETPIPPPTSGARSRAGSTNFGAEQLPQRGMSTAPRP